MYNSPISFGAALKLDRLITVCLNKACRKIRTDKYLSDTFPTKNVLNKQDNLSTLLFKFCLSCVNRKVQENQEKIKLNV